MQFKFAINAKYKAAMLKDLEVFVAAAEAGNFSLAARALDVAVSSITRRIEGLEEELGCTLFLRGSRKLVLTDAGQHFLGTARNVLAELSDARDELSSRDREPHGLLTITAPASFGRRHIAPAVRTFLEEYSRMQVDLHLSDRVTDLSVKRIDLAIRIGRDLSGDLIATQIAPLRRLVCAAPSYLARAGRPETLKQLLEHECLTVSSRPTPPGWWTFPGLNRGAPLQVNGRFQCDDTETLLDAAVAGLGVVHLASWLVGDHLRDGRLVQLFPSEDGTAVKGAPAIYAARLPGRSHAARARLFLDHVRAHIGAPPYWDRMAGDIRTDVRQAHPDSPTQARQGKPLTRLA
ncbi:LysR family transcriptional regulator [Paraburkholderia bryophila]|uniref:LysR family transcriptional regulator n=1 Tax=Paraburkholderia bryophila TaxID=420952 RepID=A0A329C4I4_9BURK|nr:LysR family transcriptional regulator [Paraburkholderia bryophila]RAS25895.1 LysR family transcriptional regulator [Paraburkholderia bryophila]